MTPSTKGDNGIRRDPKSGQFRKGNRGGSGNPFAKTINRLRGVLLNAITESDMRDVVMTLVEKARGGDIGAIKVLLDRLLGPPVSADLLARLENLEEKIE